MSLDMIKEMEERERNTKEATEYLEEILKKKYGVTDLR